MIYLLLISLFSVLLFTYVAVSAYVQGEMGSSKSQLVSQEDIEFWETQYEKLNSSEAINEYKRFYY